MRLICLGLRVQTQTILNCLKQLLEMSNFDADSLSKVHIKLDRSVYKQGQHIKPEVEVTLETGKVARSSLISHQLGCR